MIWIYIEAKTKGIIFSVAIIQVGTLTSQFLKSRKRNNFVQYSFRLSVLAPISFYTAWYWSSFHWGQNRRDDFLSCDHPGWNVFDFSISQKEISLLKQQSSLSFLSSARSYNTRQSIKLNHYSNWALFLYRALISGVGPNKVTIIRLSFVLKASSSQAQKDLVRSKCFAWLCIVHLTLPQL